MKGVRRLTMYDKIMVPLDGSDLAECVMPHVKTIISAFTLSQVALVRVVNPTRLPVSVPAQGDYGFTEKDRQRMNVKRKKAAENYLVQLSDSLEHPGTKFECVVLEGSPVNMLSDFAANHAVDIIIMASHGRSGISRWVMGSVAERIVRTSCVPVMLVRAPGCDPKSRS